MGTLMGHISMCKVLRAVPVTEQVLWDASLIWTGSLSGSHYGNMKYWHSLMGPGDRSLCGEAGLGRRGQNK